MNRLVVVILIIFSLNIVQLKIIDSFYYFIEDSYSELHIAENKIYFINDFFGIEIYDYSFCDDSIKLFRGDKLSKVINIIKHDDGFILEEGIYKFNLYRIDKLEEVENYEKLYQDYLKREELIKVGQKDI